MSRGDPEDQIPALLRLTDAFANQVDVLVGLRGLDPEAFSRTVAVPFHGSTLEFVGREDFIAMKVSAGGPLDLLDAERAVAADPASLDVQLVRGLAARFSQHASAAFNSILSAELGAGDDATEGS